MKKKSKNIFRILRTIVETVFFAGITLMLLDFTGVLHAWLGWMAKVQMFPAVMAVDIIVILAIILITLVFGRVYCSTICPLGAWQDTVSRARGGKAGRRFAYSGGSRWLRYGILGVVAVAAVAGISVLAYALDPYSNWGRIVSSIFQPVYILANNLGALISRHIDSYAFYEADVWLKSLPALVFAAVVLIAVTVMAWKKGRLWCNTICPVGALLGLFSRFSWFKPVIDTEKCVNCGLCGKSCKASCIDTVNHSIDYSRCVTCFDCLDNCNTGAISFSHKPAAGKEKGNDASRRAFLTGSAIFAGASLFEAKAQKLDGGLAEIIDKKAPERDTPVKPAGSTSLSSFSRHCTACQLCVAQCPNGVLRPSNKLSTFMQPEMSFERGYCRPECTICSHVCPAGAIKPVTVEEKSSIQTGHAVWTPFNCIPLTDGQSCGNCARHCPVGAIQMVRLGDTPYMEEGMDPELMIPAVNEDKCIGCGACENLCPARPFSAIYVEGHEVHRIN